MQARISEHRHRRGPGWQSVEAPLDVTAALADLPATGTLLLDCATLWLTNHMLAGHDLDARTADLVAAFRDCRGRVVVVSNELGMGLVPETRLGRVFRDAQGRLNQALAAQADLAVLVVAGLPVVLKGALPDGPP